MRGGWQGGVSNTVFVYTRLLGFPDVGGCRCQHKLLGRLNIFVGLVGRGPMFAAAQYSVLNQLDTVLVPAGCCACR